MESQKQSKGPAAGGPVLLDSGEQLNPYRWIILCGLITAAILEVLDTTIVNVSLPEMAGNLGATTEEIGWVSTGYILSNVIVLPMTAWLSGRFGRKRYLTGSILLFIAASFFCGTSHSLGELVFWRIVQGCGGAALLSTAQATLREIFPREQQGTVQAIYILGIIVAPTVGPTLGGWITDNYNWPWIFFVNIPIGLISAGIVYSFLEDAPYQVRSNVVDWLGIGLLASGLGSLQYVLEEGNRDDWFQSPTISILAVIAAIALTSMVFWELSPRNTHPIVNFRVLKNRDLSASLFLFMALGFGLYGGIFIFPLFSQNILHFTPTLTGLTLLPGGVATGVSAIICGRLVNPGRQLIPPRILILFGMSLFVFSMWDLAHLTTASGSSDAQFGLIVRGFGLGFLFTPINLAALNSLKGVEIPQGTALMNLMRQLGGSFGIAVLGTYITNMTEVHRSALIAHISPSNPAYQHTMTTLTHAMMAKGLSPAAAQHAAIGVIAGDVQIQAVTLSYDNAFLLIGLAVVVVSPAVLVLRNKMTSGPGMDVGGH
ncbi:MAG: DHA2 family efflux MFS transporter permease subunit [Armatimonadota bacterium]|nr:DHA2 family efflux MFS transporter permease subunit [Armatimonadota bacterium]